MLWKNGGSKVVHLIFPICVMLQGFKVIKTLFIRSYNTKSLKVQLDQLKSSWLLSFLERFKKVVLIGKHNLDFKF